VSSKSTKQPYIKAAGWIVSAAFVFATAGPFTGSQIVAQTQAKHASHNAGGFTQPEPIDFNDHQGWTRIFDGKTLEGWDGSPEVWHVENGAIVGESSPQHPSGTTNIIWRGGRPANFELKVEMKLEGEGANGGIQYRSINVPPSPPGPIPADRLSQMTEKQKQQMRQREALAQKYAKWNLKGYQADFDFSDKYTGQLYEQGTGRGIVAWRGQMVETDQGKKPRLLATLGTSDQLKAFIKPGDWNQYEVIADGNTLIHIINGHVMAILVDNDPTFSQSKGLIGFEIEGGGVVKISQKNVWLKILP
jgi:hypothetical protein